MATGVQAIARVAEAMGEPLVYVTRGARVLREADPVFWPEAGKGGGIRSAHTQPRHLSNLVLCLTVVDTLTAGPEAVLAYRSLTLQRTQLTRWTRDPLTNEISLSSREWAIDHKSHHTAWLNGPTFGDGLDYLIDDLHSAKHTGRLRYVFPGPRLLNEGLGLSEETGLSVRLTIGSPPQAVVRGIGYNTADDGLIATDIYLPDPNLPFWKNTAAPPRSAPQSIKILPIELFVALSELWADTLARQHDARLTPSPSA